MSEKAKRKGIVQFPEKGKARCLDAICYGNSRIADLLDYFIYGANLEAGYQDLDESCKVVTITRKHKDILEKLNFNLSRKTLIRYLDLLNEWGYVSSQPYAKDFTVNGDKIQEAIAKPPQKPARAPREPRTAADQKSCNVVDLQLSKVVEELQQKVVNLQLKVVELQQNVVNLQQKVDILSTLQPALDPLVESAGGHNFDPYSNNSNNNNITVINIPNEPATSTFVANATIPFVSSDDDLEQKTSHIVIKATNENAEPKTTRNHQSLEQNPLFDAAPKSPIMPPESTKWCAETLVQIVEFRRNKRFLEDARGKNQKSQRERQLDAAKKIIDANITREEFIKAYDARNDAWWQDNRGDLTVVDMAAKTTKGVMRTLEVLENIDSKKGVKTQSSGHQAQPSQCNSILTQEEKDFRKWLVSQPQEERPKILKARREARLAAQAQA